MICGGEKPRRGEYPICEGSEQFLENIREFRTKGESIITLEKYIYDCGTHFIKTVTNSILNYFTQAYYMKKIIK